MSKLKEVSLVNELIDYKEINYIKQKKNETKGKNNRFK